MSETPNPAPEPPRPEYTWAFTILRLFLGLRTFFEGVEKFERNGRYTFANYYENMKGMAQGITSNSFLPLWATRFYADGLGYVLLVLGALLLLGVKSRCVLILTGLLYVSLSFGLMVVQENEGVAWLGIHVVLIVMALVLVRHERFALLASKRG